MKLVFASHALGIVHWTWYIFKAWRFSIIVLHICMDELNCDDLILVEWIGHDLHKGVAVKWRSIGLLNCLVDT